MANGIGQRDRELSLPHRLRKISQAKAGSQALGDLGSDAFVGSQYRSMRSD
jgi:hypothetical protein